jgi:hypothetical protein
MTVAEKCAKIRRRGGRNAARGAQD